MTGLPAIGCAKSRLIGAHEEPARQKGSIAPLFDNEERIGSVVRIRDGVRPVFVSIGHRIDLSTAERLVLACAMRFRLPEPTPPGGSAGWCGQKARHGRCRGLSGDKIPHRWPSLCQLRMRVAMAPEVMRKKIPPAQPGILHAKDLKKKA